MVAQGCLSQKGGGACVRTRIIVVTIIGAAMSGLMIRPGELGPRVS